MIALVSRWKLKNGCPPELTAALEELTAAVESQEPGTLMFAAHLKAPHPPLGPPPEYEVSDDPDAVRAVEQAELVLFEVYRDAEAYSAHLRGPATEFRRQNSRFFITPWQGHPRPEVIYLDPRSAFVRSALLEAGAVARQPVG